MRDRSPPPLLLAREESQSQMKIIQNFCTPEELTTLRNIAKTLRHFPGTRPGLYKGATVCGFGYGDEIPGGVHDAIYQKFLAASGLTPPLKGRGIQQFISYAKDGWIHPHKDWVDPGCNLYRVNVLVDAAGKGGECIVDGVEAKLGEGDAIVLRAELEEHQVKPILEGSRMIFTIGFHHREPKANG
jgi:hypothetical protein